MADDAIERLKREVAGGDVGQRRALVQALLRAGRPLGQAWPNERVSVSLGAAWETEPVLEAVARVDPRRVRANLGDRGSAMLLDQGSEDLRVRVADGEVRLYMAEYDYEFDQHLPRWTSQGWRWKVDAPPYAVAAAGAAGLAAVLRIDGRLLGGSPEDVAAGRGWERAVPDAVALAVGHGRVAAVSGDRLRIWDGASGEEVGERRLPFAPTAADLEPGGTRLALVQGRSRRLAGVEVGALEPGDARVVFSEVKLKIDGSHRLGRVVCGADRVAVVAGDVGVWSLDGASLGVAARGSHVHRWEDPESTMGLSREVHEFERRDAELVDAAWAGGQLVTLDADGRLDGWSRSRGAWTATRQEPRGEGLRLAGDPSGAVAVNGDRSVRLWGTRSETLEFDRTVTAAAWCGGRLLVGLTDGRCALVG